MFCYDARFYIKLYQQQTKLVLISFPIMWLFLRAFQTQKTQKKSNIKIEKLNYKMFMSRSNAAEAKKEIICYICRKPNH